MVNKIGNNGRLEYTKPAIFSIPSGEKIVLQMQKCIGCYQSMIGILNDSNLGIKPLGNPAALTVMEIGATDSNSLPFLAFTDPLVGIKRYFAVNPDYKEFSIPGLDDRLQYLRIDLRPVKKDFGGGFPFLSNVDIIATFNMGSLVTPEMIETMARQLNITGTPKPAISSQIAAYLPRTTLAMLNAAELIGPKRIYLFNHEVPPNVGFYKRDLLTKLRKYFNVTELPHHNHNNPNAQHIIATYPKKGISI